MRPILGIFGLIASLGLLALSNAAHSWELSCDPDSRCVISEFVEDPATPNLAMGLIFSGLERRDGLSMRVLGPLGMDIERGFFIDLNYEELGKARAKTCSSAGCVADVSLSSLALVPLRATKNIGVTVWNSDGTPYRIAFDSGNLGKFLDKLVPDPLEGVLVSEAKHPYLSGIAKVAFASNASNCGDFQPRYIEFSIEDGRAISSYISNSNSTIKLIMDKYNNELSDVNRSMEFYDNLKSVISENASEQAKHVDIDSVKFDELMTNTLSSMSVRKCSSNGFVAVQEPEYTPEGNNPYADWFVSRAAGSSKGDWVSDASLTDLESGETIVYGGPVNQYVLGAFSSAVVARTLAERYGIEYRDAQ